MKVVLIAIALFSSVINTKADENILTSQEHFTYCGVISNVNQDITGQFSHLAKAYGFSDVSEFVNNHLALVKCAGRISIIHAVRNEFEDMIGFLDSGFKVNTILKLTDGRKITILDFVMQSLDSAGQNYRSLWIKKLIELKSKRAAKTCHELGAICLGSHVNDFKTWVEENGVNSPFLVDGVIHSSLHGRKGLTYLDWLYEQLSKSSGTDSSSIIEKIEVMKNEYSAKRCKDLGGHNCAYK